MDPTAALYRVLLLVVLLTAVLSQTKDGNETSSSQANSTVFNEFNPKTYQEAEKEITDYINSYLRSLLPKIVGGSEAATLTPKCTASMMKIFGNVRKLKGWTLKMLDSIGKPTSGILRGKSYSIGHYEQCLDISVSSRGLETTDPSDEMFRGQYCKVRISMADVVIERAKDYHRGLVDGADLGKLREFIESVAYVPLSSEYMNHFFGVCLPSLCTMEDVQQILKIVSFPGSATVDRCEEKTETEFNFNQSIIIGIFVFLMCIVCLGTLVDWLFLHRRCEKVSGLGDNRCISIAVSFSACNNTKRLLGKIQEDEDTPVNCIRGVFAASVVWMIIGHTYLFPYQAFYDQASTLENLGKYLDQKKFAFVVSFPLAIDSLFMCYGFLLTYKLWHSTSKKQKVNVNVIRVIVQRYIRLCFPLAFCLGLLFMLPLVGSGPFWADIFDDTIDKCKKTGWAYIGMYGNFLDFKDQCLPHLWFFPCLMQITIVGAFMCWVLAKNMKIGVFVLILISLASNLVVGVLTVENELPPAFVSYFIEKYSSLFWKVNYSLPLSHFAPFAVGMISGIVTARGMPCRLNPILALIGWILSIAAICGLILGLHYYRDGTMPMTWSAVYASGHRTLFSLCVAWVIMACSFGNGGFINAILSWRVFDPVLRLSYFAYLLHFIVITFFVGTAREQFHYCHLPLLLRAVGYICITYLISYICFLMLEMPLRSLQSSLYKSRRREMPVSHLQDIISPKPIQMGALHSKNSCQLWSVTESKNGTS